MILVRKSKRLDTATSVCDFAMSSRAFTAVTTMSTADHRNNVPVRLDWATKFRSTTVICSRCLSVGHTRQSCAASPRCHRCGGTEHTREYCTVAEAIPVLCLSHSSSVTGAQSSSTTRRPTPDDRRPMHPRVSKPRIILHYRVRVLMRRYHGRQELQTIPAARAAHTTLPTCEHNCQHSKTRPQS